MKRASRPARRVSICLEGLEGRRLLSTLQQDVQTLVTDVKSIHAGSNVTTSELKVVGADFQAIARVASKPSATSVAAFEAEIKVVIAQGSITPAQTIILEKDVAAVLRSANISQALAQQTATDIGVVITASGITRADVKQIAGDVKAIVDDLAALKH